MITPNKIEFIDLGLPSGIKWAKCNVGAETETDYGYHFQWGDIVDKSNSDCSWESYKYCSDSYNILTKYTPYGNNPDNKITLDNEDDAATQIMGGNWRIPKKNEIQELLDNTIKQWVTINDVYGYKFTGSNGNSIFIPASGRCYGSRPVRGVGCGGYIWSSSLCDSYPYCAWYLGFIWSRLDVSCCNRSHGLSVRGVID